MRSVIDFLRSRNASGTAHWKVDIKQSVSVVTEHSAQFSQSNTGLNSALRLKLFKQIHQGHRPTVHISELSELSELKTRLLIVSGYGES